MYSTYIFNTENKHLCTGCGACVQICRHQAIEMKEDSEGFIYPALNESECIKCGSCEKHCPVVNGKNENSDYNQRYYMATNVHTEDSIGSATIGICTMISRYAFQKGWFVCGVSLDESQWKSYHSFADKKSDIDSFKNSKYIQSDTKRTFSETKAYLQGGGNVLYIGTPCQIAGLKSYLGKQYDSLYTIDLICHGVYSYKLLEKEINYWEKRYGGVLYDFRFRSKEKYPWSIAGVVSFNLEKNGIKKHHEILAKGSPTYHCFVKSLNLRQSCYSCPFRSESRYGDLSVGDAWRLEDVAKVMTATTRKYGISSVFVNTHKGSVLLDLIKEQINRFEYSYDHAFCQPALKMTTREIPVERGKIYSNIHTQDYGKLISTILNIDIDKEADRAYMEFYKNEKMRQMKKIIKKMIFYDQLKQLRPLVKFVRYLKSLYHGFTRGSEWYIVNSILAHFPSKHVRYYGLKFFGAKLAKNVRFYQGFHIRNPKGVSIADGVSVGPKVLLDGRRGLSIGKSAVIAYEAIIWTLNHDYNDINFCGKGTSVTIGDYAWICSRAIVLPGINIGEGAVVASGAIVTHDVPPYTVVGGIPAKPIGKREKKEWNFGYKHKFDYQRFS